MKAKKGFTLIELMAVIAIVCLIFSLSMATVFKIHKNVLQKDYDNLVTYLETQAANYANKTNITTVSVEKLIEEGYVQPDDEINVYNPIDNSSMNCYILKSTLKDREYIAELKEDLGAENGECKTYESTSEFQICKLDTKSGICDDIKNTDWFNDKIILAVKYRNENKAINSDDIKFYWTSTSGESSEENIITADATLISQNTYKVEVIVNNNVKGEASQLVNIDKQSPTIISSSNNTDWSFQKDFTVDASDMSGSGIKGYSFPDLNENCNNYISENTHVYTKEGTYTYCVMDNAGNITTATTLVEKIDNATPVMPTITPSDGVNQDNWHKSDFELRFSSIGEQSKSKITYYYGTSQNNLNEFGEKVLININFNGKTIYVKACNEAKTCSEINSYKILYDNTPPAYVSGGSLGNGSISKPEYKDNNGGSGNTTVYVCVTSGNAPTSYDDSCFSSVNTTFNTSCGTRYKLYSYAVDNALNKSVIYDHYSKNNISYYRSCSSSSSSSSYSSSSNTKKTPSCDSTCQMQKNSSKWWDYQNNTSISDSERKKAQDALHQENVKLASGNSDCKGSCQFTNDGHWRDSSGNKLYSVSGGSKTSSKSKR